MPWVDTETGEVLNADCPKCESTRQECETQIQAMEKERRQDRSARTRAENAAAKAEMTKRDGKLWLDILAHWMAAFPEKRVTSKGTKSARATKLFQRLESGATAEDVKLAINGAKAWPYVVYGKRQKSGSKSDLANDLEDIVSVNADRQFDWLVAEGEKLAAPDLF